MSCQVCGSTHTKKNGVQRKDNSCINAKTAATSSVPEQRLAKWICGMPTNHKSRPAICIKYLLRETILQNELYAEFYGCFSLNEFARVQAGLWGCTAFIEEKRVPVRALSGKKWICTLWWQYRFYVLD